MARRLPHPLPPPLLGLLGVFGPSQCTTIRGGACTFPKVPLEEVFHICVVLSLQSQLNEQLHQIILRMCTSHPLRSRPAILLRAKADFTNKAQVGFVGCIGTRVSLQEQILQIAHIFRDSRSRRKLREHRKVLNLCAYTEIRLIDGECFLQPLENLSPSGTGIYSLFNLFHQKFVFT